VARTIVRAAAATTAAIIARRIVGTTALTDVTRRVVGTTALADVARRIIGTTALTDVTDGIVSAATGEGRGGSGGSNGCQDQRRLDNITHRIVPSPPSGQVGQDNNGSWR
jgi:hypothetical protein